MSKDDLIKLFRACEADKRKWGDNPVDFEYFIDWLESLTPVKEREIFEQ